MLVWMLQRTKPEASVEIMGVLCNQAPAAHRTEVRVRQYCLDQPMAKSFSAKGFQNVNVGQVGVSRIIGHRPDEPNLLSGMINTEAKGVLKGFFHHRAGPRLSPVGVLQESADGFDVQPGWIGADREFSAVRFQERNLIVL